jgi:hypothetical protein
LGKPFNYKKAYATRPVTQQIKDLSSALMTDLPQEIAIMQEGPAKDAAIAKFTGTIEQQSKFVEDLGQQSAEAAEQKKHILDQQDEIKTDLGAKILSAQANGGIMTDDPTLPPTEPDPEFSPDEGFSPNGETGLNSETANTQFSKGSDLDNWLSTTDREQAQRELEGKVSSDEELQVLRDALERYYSAENPAEREKIAGDILAFGILPMDMVSSTSQPNTVETTYKKNIDDTIASTEESLKKLAQTKSSKPFNLSKYAQAKTESNIITFGPNQVRVDPFSRMPASEWSIVERNKGFGLVVDDVWNIDWESVWRGNIMDKYMRPYRDKEGNWVGGYLNKRFEIDRWQPEANRYQLKPGAKRRPYIAESRLIETRLVDQRNKEAEEKGWGPEPEKDKPYNWHKVETNKIKLAQSMMSEPNGVKDALAEAVQNAIETNTYSKNIENIVRSIVHEFGPSEVYKSIFRTLPDFYSEKPGSTGQTEPITQDLNSQDLNRDSSFANETVQDVVKWVESVVERFAEGENPAAIAEAIKTASVQKKK